MFSSIVPEILNDPLPLLAVVDKLNVEATEVAIGYVKFWPTCDVNTNLSFAISYVTVWNTGELRRASLKATPTSSTVSLTAVE